jgi:hypothetical protein
MTSVAFVAPLLPGGAARLRQLAKDVLGPRAAEAEDFHRRMKVTTENWYLQQTPQGDVVIVFLEGEDFGHTFGSLAVSREPFDVWFKEQAKRVHGIDFDQPPQAPLPELVYSSRST